MKLGKRTVLTLLFALVCLNLLIRLPRTDHESGIDTYAIHVFAGAISAQGRIPWVINALGYFGWYPLSYPSAGPLLISSTSQLTGLSIEQAILSLSMWYGVLGVLTAFAMARTFRPNDTFALLVATLFSLAPRFMSFTSWSASSRSPFMVLLPVFIWALVRSYRRPTLANMTILVTVLLVMIATHRLTILLAVVILAFVVAYVFIMLNRVIRIQFPKTLLAARVRRSVPVFALAAILAIAAFMLLQTDVLKQYTEGVICSGDSPLDEMCNLGVSITRSVGLSIFFAIPGIVYLVRARNKGFLEAFVSLSLVALIPTLFLRQYTGFYILPFVALFAAFGIEGLLSSLRRHPRTMTALSVATVLVIAGTSAALLQYEIDRASTISNANYSTALYLADLPAGFYVANDGLLTIHLSSISGRPGLPVGGAGTTSQSPELLIMGAFRPYDLTSHERRIALTELTIEDDSPFVVDHIDALSDWQKKVLWLDVDKVSNDTWDYRYHLQYYVELDEIRGAYDAFGSTYRTTPSNPSDPFSNFANSIHEKRYKLWDGTTEDIYLAFPPLTG